LADQITNVRLWMQYNAIATLNIAGPRRSSSPSLSKIVYPFLIELLQTSDCFADDSHCGHENGPDVNL